MTPVSFVKTTESYEVSLVNESSRQTSYDSGILCQDYGIIRSLPMSQTRFADLITILDTTFTGTDRNGRA